MQSIGPKEILLVLLLLFLFYLIAAMFAVEGWAIYRLLTGRRVLPARPLVSRRAVPWGLWTVLFSVVLYVVVNIGCVAVYARITGRKPSVAGVKSTTGELALSMTEGMAIGVVIDLVLLIILPLLLKVTSRSPLRDLGLSFDRWWLQAAVGVFALLAIQPVIFGVQIAMTRVWESNAHPLQKMVLDEFSPGVPELAILTAVFVAPAFEEMMFRGIIQSWLVSLGCRRRRESKPVVLVESVAIPAIESSMPTSDWNPDPGPWDADLDVTVERLPEMVAPAANHTSQRRSSGLPGIVLTSLIFAALHAPQWPAPIALFVFSIVIGYVYHRTGSLITAFCMHATFNGLSTLALLGSLLAPQPAHRAKSPVAKAPVSVVDISAKQQNACICRGKCRAAPGFL